MNSIMIIKVFKFEILSNNNKIYLNEPESPFKNFKTY